MNGVEGTCSWFWAVTAPLQHGEWGSGNIPDPEALVSVEGEK